MDKNEENTEENNDSMPIILRSKRNTNAKCCGEMYFIFVQTYKYCNMKLLVPTEIKYKQTQIILSF